VRVELPRALEKSRRESRYWRHQPHPHRTRPAVGFLDQQIRRAEQRLAEKAAGDAAGDLVVDRRTRRLAGDLPERAAGKRVRGRFPVVEAGRSREAVIHRALIRMADLVDLERVVIDNPGSRQVSFDRRSRHAERVGVVHDETPAGIDQSDHADDFERGDDEAGADAALGRDFDDRRLVRGPLLCLFHGRRRRAAHHAASGVMISRRTCIY
jgi:hypothetical protein